MTTGIVSGCYVHVGLVKTMITCCVLSIRAGVASHNKEPQKGTCGGLDF